MCPTGAFPASFVIVTPIAQPRMRPLALLNLCYATGRAHRVAVVPPRQARYAAGLSNQDSLYTSDSS
jgi:hypothetical protein